MSLPNRSCDTLAAYKTARNTYRHQHDDLLRYQSTRTIQEQHAAARSVADHHQALKSRAAEIHQELE